MTATTYVLAALIEFGIPTAAFIVWRRRRARHLRLRSRIGQYHAGGFGA